MRAAWWLLLAVGPALGEGFFFGLTPPGTGEPPEVERRELLAAGCTLVELPLRLDLFDRPGGPAQADAAIAELRAGGAEPLLRLIPGLTDAPPAGLAEPIFNTGADWPSFDAAANPANAVAGWAARLAERYDGDGRGDAPDKLRVGYYLIVAPAFSGERFTWPGGAEQVARYISVVRAALRQADYSARVGLEAGGLEPLAALLEQTRWPLGGQLDFQVVTSPGATSSDGTCWGPGGACTAADALAAEYDQRGSWAPKILVRGGVPASPAGGPAERAAVAKLLISTAAEGRLGCLVHGLRAGPVGRRSDAATAFSTVSRLLGRRLADGTLRPVEPLALGAAARGWRFDDGFEEVFVAWAQEFDGDVGRRVRVALPLSPGTVVHRCRWDFARTGRPDERLVAGADGLPVELGIDPEYFLTGDAPLAEPLPEDRDAAEPPWRWSACERAGEAALLLDSRLETGWSTSSGARRWVQLELDEPATADRLRLFLAAGSGRVVVVQASLDGVLWRDVGRAAASDAADWAEVGFGRQSSRWWRIVIELPPEQTLTVWELELADLAARVAK